MAIPVSWQCTKCGKITMAGQKPGTGNTNYGKCLSSLKGQHHWVRK